ncbi:MAG: NAD(P)-dependent oxidoreductase [Prevotella sp.]|nr:NAD(P)-dependent oxidoreductase [Prevotella sp.]
MRYVITGGNSFLGAALCKLLVSKGHEVIVACRKNSKTDAILQSPLVEIVRYEGLHNMTSVLKIGSADVFIHLAWNGTGHEGRDNHEVQEENITYSLEAVNIAKKLNCKLFVEAGSQAEYGIVEGKMSESTECHPLNEYGKAKLKFGEVASKRCLEFGMKFIHLRILSVFGETDHPWTLVMSCVRKMLNNEDIQLSSCEQLWNFVSVSDAVKQIYLLCKNALDKTNFRSEIFLIGSNDTRVLRSFVNEIHHLTKSKSKLLFGTYNGSTVVSLYPDMSKTENATGGFISDYTFGEVVTNIINKFRNGDHD